MQDRIRNREQREQQARALAQLHNERLAAVEKSAHDRIERIPSRRQQQHDEQDG